MMKTAFSRRLLAILLVAAMCLSVMPAMVFAAGETSQEIVFKGNGKTGDGSELNNQTLVSDVVGTGADLVSSFSDISKVYIGKEDYGLKFGSSSATGKITVNLKTPVKVKSVVVTAKKYNTSASCLTVQAGTKSLIQQSLTESFTTYTLECNGEEVSSITLSTANSGKRCYVQSIELVLESSCEHTYGDFSVTKEPTCTEKGLKVRTCSKCNNVEEVEIEALGHTVPNDKGLCTRCGADLTIPTFVKVTENLTDWTGTYLIVYETGSVIFDGSLTQDADPISGKKLDQANNYQSVTISADNKIEADKKYSFSIEKFENSSYTIKSASGWYIYNSVTSNGLSSSQDNPGSVSIVFTDNKLTIQSGSTYLKYNNTSNQNRFRFYGSGQQDIQLYKLVETTPLVENNVVLDQVSATLDGTIGLNYFVKLPEAVLKDETACVKFKVNGTERETININGMTAEKDGRYRFTCPVYAMEMHDEVTVEVYSNGQPVDLYAKGVDLGTSYKYTLAKYFSKLIEVNQANPEQEKLVNLAKATLTYGSYAQVHFKENPGTLEYPTSIADVNDQTLAAYAISATGTKPAGCGSVSVILNLKDVTTIKLYVNTTDTTTYTFTLDGKTVTSEPNNGQYYFEIPNIAANDLNKEHTLVINGEYTITFSALTYAHAALTDNSQPDDVKNLVKALYLYNQAANAYFTK